MLSFVTFYRHHCSFLPCLALPLHSNFMASCQREHMQLCRLVFWQSQVTSLTFACSMFIYVVEQTSYTNTWIINQHTIQDFNTVSFDDACVLLPVSDFFVLCSPAALSVHLFLQDWRRKCCIQTYIAVLFNVNNKKKHFTKAII